VRARWGRSPFYCKFLTTLYPPTTHHLKSPTAPADRPRDRWKSCIHIYIYIMYNIKCNIAVSRAKCHVGIKSKIVFLACRGHAYIYILHYVYIVRAEPSSKKAFNHTLRKEKMYNIRATQPWHTRAKRIFKCYNSIPNNVVVIVVFKNI